MKRLALLFLVAACSERGADPASAECRSAHDAYRAAFVTAMGDRMAQLGSWGEKPDMESDLAVGKEMAESMTEQTMSRAELETMRATESKGGALAPEWERAIAAAGAAIDACGEKVAPPRR